MSAHAATNPAHGPAPADPVSHPLHRTLRRQRGDTRDPAPGQQRNQAAGGAVRRTIDLLRYRYDLERKLRYKTVELIVVEAMTR